MVDSIKDFHAHVAGVLVSSDARRAREAFALVMIAGPTKTPIRRRRQLAAVTPADVGAIA